MSLGFRDKYQNIIKNLVQNADQCSHQWILTGDPEWYEAYTMYVEKVCELKEWIKKRESEIENMPL
jgi:hypothetical protein